MSMAFTQNSSPQSFLTPLPAAPPQASVEVLPVYASEKPYFDLMYHPKRWDWIGGQWLPTLRRLAHTPGSQNVDKDSSTHMAIAIEAQAGWVRIPHDLPEGDYLSRYPARLGFAHFFRWERLKVLGGELHTTADEQGYVEWLSAVVARMGMSPDPYILQWKIDRLETSNGEDEARAITDPRAAARFKKTNIQLDAMRAAMRGDAPVVEVVEAPPSPRRKS